jgi:hypothetical protein
MLRALPLNADPLLDLYPLLDPGALIGPDPLLDPDRPLDRACPPLHRLDEAYGS